MEPQTKQSRAGQHDIVKQQYDEVQSDGRYEEGMARMALYHRHCQDPVIFGTLGDIRGKSLLDVACGDGFYTRRFRTECAANPVMGIDLSPSKSSGLRRSNSATNWASSTESATSCHSSWNTDSMS